MSSSLHPYEMRVISHSIHGQTFSDRTPWPWASQLGWDRTCFLLARFFPASLSGHFLPTLLGDFPIWGHLRLKGVWASWPTTGMQWAFMPFVPCKLKPFLVFALPKQHRIPTKNLFHSPGVTAFNSLVYIFSLCANPPTRRQDCTRCVIQQLVFSPNHVSRLSFPIHMWGVIRILLGRFHCLNVASTPLTDSWLSPISH